MFDQPLFLGGDKNTKKIWATKKEKRKKKERKKSTKR